MNRYDDLYRVYEQFDTQRLREYQDYVDTFPPVDSRVALEHWQNARDELDAHLERIADRVPDGAVLADIAAHATLDQAFTALDLYSKYGRAVNVLVLDVDETLRTAGRTDNEIPRETLHFMRELAESGFPIVICTGQTLENVKGFLIQGLGNEVVNSGTLSVVYESGNGVYSPGHGADTKRLLYERLDGDVREVFESVNSGVLRDAPGAVRRGCHLQGNEFNVTLKPNFETGSPEAADVIDRALVHLLRQLAAAVTDDPDGFAWVRAHYAGADPEIATVLDDAGLDPDVSTAEIPADVADLLERVDVAYYHADAAEVTSLELDKTAGVDAAFEVLGIDDPFALVVGDSKTDLRVMEATHERGTGICAAPRHASEDVLAFVESTDDLVFSPGDSVSVLRIVYALSRIAALDG